MTTNISPENHQSPTTGNTRRRQFLQASAALSAAGVLAGCIGGGGDGGGGGTNGDGGSSGPDVPEEVGFLVGAGYIPAVIGTYIWDETNLLEDELHDIGVENVVYGSSHEDVSLFAAGQADMSVPSLEEAGIVASRREFEVEIHGQIQYEYTGTLTKPGSPYDPEVSGGPRQSFEQLVEDQALFAYPDWGAFTTPHMRMILGQWGIDFTEGNNDVNTRILGYGGTTTQALRNDNAVAALGSTTSGAGPAVKNGELTYIFPMLNALLDGGFIKGPTGVLATTAELSQEYPEVVKAFLRVYEQAIAYVHEDPVETVRNEEWWWPILGVDNADDAEWTARETILAEYDIRESTVPERARFTDQHATDYVDYLDEVAATTDGIVPEDWADWMSISVWDDISAG